MQPVWSVTGALKLEGSFDLMLCCYCLEILKKHFNKGPHIFIYTGTDFQIHLPQAYEDMGL